MKRVHLAIGFDTAPSPDWRRILPPPVKPGNYKEATWLEKLPELEAAQQRDAREMPLAGRISELCLIDLSSGMGDTVREVTAVTATADALMVHLQHLYRDPTNCVLYGVDVRDRLRQLGMGGPLGGYFMVDSPLTPMKIDIMTLSGLRTAKIPLATWYSEWGGPSVGGTAAAVEARMVAYVVSKANLPACTDDGVYNH